MKIYIYLKEFDDDNKERLSCDVKVTTIKEAKKTFNKLIKQWKKNKPCIIIPGYAVAIASERIYSIVFDRET